MNRSLFRSILLLITYAVVLIMVIFRFDVIWSGVGKVISALSPLWIGFAIAFVLNRPTLFLRRKLENHLPDKVKRWARPLSVLSVYLLVILFIVTLVAVVVPELIKSVELFTSNLGTYALNLQELYERLENRFNLSFLGDIDFAQLNVGLGDILNRALRTISDTIPHLFAITKNVLSGALTLLLALIFSIYMLADSDKLKAQTRRMATSYLPEKISAPMLRIVRRSSETFGNFVRGQTVEAIILGVLCFIGMSIFRFEYAPLISTLVGVSALIPIAGAYIGGAAAFLLLVMINPIRALWFLLFLVVLQQLENTLIYPRVVGDSVGLPGLWVMAAVTVGGGLFGFVGMLIGVPVSAILYSFLQEDLREKHLEDHAD